MVTILPQQPTIAEQLGSALGAGLSGYTQGVSQRQQLQDQLQFEKMKQEGSLRQKLLDTELKEREKEKRAEAFKKMGLDESLAELDPSIAKEYVKDSLFEKLRSNLLKSDSSISIESDSPGRGEMSLKETTDTTFERIPDSTLQAMLIDPRYEKLARYELDKRQKQDELRRKEFIEDRKYNSDYTKKLEENVNELRGSLQKKENALDLAKNAVETGDLNFFSLDNLANRTGIDLFRTAKGAQLITAGKENLLNNMGRVSARAQNIWFEQRLNSMFPQIGQSKEANLTIQEMLEGENALDKAYVNEFDRLAEDDEKKYGYVKKDIERRARSNIKPFEERLFKRTSYRLKDIEEREKGLSRLKKEVGKKVVKGTPLTLSMAKLYKDKFGDKALEVAKKNGYSIPTIEDFEFYQQSFRDMDE